MSKYSPEEYSGVNWKAFGRYEARRDREAEEERLDALAQEAEERRARELAFNETPFCEEACYETMIHTVACQAINSPVTAAISGWRRSQQIAVVISETASADAFVQEREAA